MLTKNFWTIFTPLVNRLNGSNVAIELALPDGTSLIDIPYASSSKPYTLLGAISVPYSNSNYGKTAGTWYGKGHTPAATEDYKMEDPIIDGSLSFTGGSNSLNSVINGDHVRISATHQVTNTTDEDITVTEIGCFGTFASSGKPFLLDHTVLETPVTIPARDTVALEYTIKFPFGM